VSAESPVRPRRLSLFLVLLIGAVAFVILALRALDRDLNHDEHQFLVPAALTSRLGLLPYRDYPLFHLPNLVFGYAILERLTGELILSAKVLSAFASTILIMLIAGVGLLRREVAGTGAWLGVFTLPLLLLCDPLFVFTAGKTWNHEVPTALLALAIVFHVRATGRSAVLWLTLSGVAAGLAVGSRLTFALALVPLACAILLFPGSWPRRFALAALFTAVTTAALTPTLFLLFQYPEPFLFGNFEFPRLPIHDPEETRIHETMTWWRKLRFFAKEVMRPSWAVFVAFIAFGWRPAWIWWKDRSNDAFGAFLVCFTLPFLLAGCFAPSRYQYQHFFAIVPILVLGIAFSAAGPAAWFERWISRAKVLAIFCVTSSLAMGYSSLKESSWKTPDWITNVSRPSEWFPARAARFGAEIRAHTGPGRIATLAPSWPIAGDLQTYPEFSTGVFGWRYAFLVPPERRKRLRLLAPEDLPTRLAEAPPAGILTGVEEKRFEQPLVDYARSHGYREVILRRKQRLWLPPIASDTILFGPNAKAP
jgi:hypothetical protein